MYYYMPTRIILSRFSVASQRLWNSLPIYVYSSHSVVYLNENLTYIDCFPSSGPSYIYGS